LQDQPPRELQADRACVSNASSSRIARDSRSTRNLTWDSGSATQSRISLLNVLLGTLGDVTRTFMLRAWDSYPRSLHRHTLTHFGEPKTGETVTISERVVEPV